MPAFLIHGVPDTHRVWDPLRARLARRDVIAPSLPGFGTPLPAGFAATKEAYTEWLIGEIERVGAPVDLVGYDWGSLLTQRIVSLRPDLVRTWACGDGPVDTEYVWHDMAQQWQTPGVGEQIMEMMAPETLAEGLAGVGIPRAAAEETARYVDATMKDAILRLYRSAIHVGAEWQPDVERVTRPALIIWAKNDLYVAPRFGERLAARVRGELVLLDCGHWWPLERPDEAVAALERFWARTTSLIATGANAMPATDGRVVRLTDERLRRLERRMAAVETEQRGQRAQLDETSERLDQAVDVLTRLVRVVAVQNRRLTRSFAQVNARLDRTTRAILKGRTADQRRMLQLERRLAALERRL